MIIIQRLLALLCVLGIADNATAGTNSYSCTTLSAQRVNDKGILLSEHLYDGFIGKHFSVDRATGQTIGGPLDNTKMILNVVDHGTTEMSFQVVATRSDSSHLTHLVVEEYSKTENKPFYGTTTNYNMGIFTGICE